MDEASYRVIDDSEGEDGLLRDMGFRPRFFNFERVVVVSHAGNPGSLAGASGRERMGFSGNCSSEMHATMLVLHLLYITRVQSGKSS